jgi:hypothetical protein
MSQEVSQGTIQNMSTHTAAEQYAFASVVPAPPAAALPGGDRRFLPAATR